MVADYGPAVFRATRFLNDKLLVYPSSSNPGAFLTFRCKGLRHNGCLTFKCCNCESEGFTRSLTVSAGRIFAVRDPEHGHHPNCVPVPEARIELVTIKRQMYRQAEDSHKRSREVYQEATCALPKTYASRPALYSELVREWPTFDAMKTPLNQHRRVNTLAVPDVQNIPLEYRVTWRGRNFPAGSPFHNERWLLHSARQGEILIFASDEDLRAIHECDYIIADGTFNRAPGDSFQFYTIHACIGGEGAPVAFVILPDKSTPTYLEMWSAIKAACEARFGTFPTGKIFLLDFELAAINAIKAMFPGSIVKGCSFHYRKAVFENFKKKGLQPIYTDGIFQEIREWLQRILAMSLLPPGEIRRMWDILKHPPVVSSVVVNLQVIDFISYFESTWISGEYPPELWSHFDHCGPRTTNHAEGFHNKVAQARELQKNPPLDEFMPWLQREHSVHQIRLAQLLAGMPAKKRRRVWVQVDEEIAHAKLRFAHHLALFRNQRQLSRDLYERLVSDYLSLCAHFVGAK